MKKLSIILLLFSFFGLLSFANHLQSHGKKSSAIVIDTIQYKLEQTEPFSYSIYVYKKNKTDTINIGIPDCKMYNLSCSSFQLNNKGSKEIIVDYYAESWGNSSNGYPGDSLFTSSSWGSHNSYKEIWDIDSVKQLFQCTYENSSYANIPDENRNDSSFYSYDVKVEPNKIILCNYKGYTNPDLEMGIYILKGNEFVLQRKSTKHGKP